MRARILVLIAVVLCVGSTLAAQPGRFTPGPGLSGDPHWRGPAASVATLPGTGNRTGDVRLALATLAVLVWDGDSWEAIAGSGGGSSTPTGPAGGALAGMYPNPTLAANYATSASPGGPATSAVTATTATLATVATSLAANGTNCTPGNYPLGIDASGNSETCTALPASGVIDHGALTGLLDDDHTQYALLAGRSGFTVFGTGITVPRGNPSSLGIAFRNTSNTDDGTGFYRSGNEIVLTVGTSGYMNLGGSYMFLTRDSMQFLIGDGADAGIRRAGVGKTAASCGTSGGTCTFVAKQYEVTAQSTAPTCSTPSLYTNSATSNTLCYCNGSTWAVVSGPGPC
jgi:hypothetical protein